MKIKEDLYPLHVVKKDFILSSRIRSWYKIVMELRRREVMITKDCI